MTIHFLKAPAQQFQKSDLPANVAGCHSRKQRSTHQPSCSSRISLQEGNQSEFTVCTSHPLVLPQALCDFFCFQPVLLRGAVIKLDVRVTFCDQAPKPQFLIVLQQRTLELFAEISREID